MFETLMKYGGYRIDVINQSAAREPGAFGFYVRGALPEGDVYSVDAKHHLYAGLEYIREKLDQHLLVAVYMDIALVDDLQRPGYVQLKQDLEAGLFRKVFVYDLNDLLGSPAAFEDFENFCLRVSGVELLTVGVPASTQRKKRRSLISQPCDLEKYDYERSLGS